MNCDWSTPGADRFTLDASAWVQRAYAADIPAPVLVELAARIRRHAYSDQVSITAESVTGGRQYEAVIGAMGFGAGRLCRTVTRPRLAGSVGALVYTVQGYSIGIAAACGNPFLLTERPAVAVRDMPASGGGGSYDPSFDVASAPTGAGVAPYTAADAAVPSDEGSLSGSAAPLVTVLADPIIMGYGGAPLSPVPELGKLVYLLFGAAVVVVVFMGHRPK